MIDVFFCSCAKPEDPIRSGMVQAVWSRWLLEQEMGRLVRVTPDILGCSGKDFQGEHRRFAALNSTTSIYIVAEDDVMPLGKRFIERGLAVMQKFPDYGSLTARAIWEQQLPEVVEANGDGIDFMRKSAMENIITPGWFDGNVQAARLREAGWKTGRMRDVAANHFGFRLGTCWPDDYQSGMTQIAEYP